MPITNNVETKKCFGEQNLHDKEYCKKEGCCFIMMDECNIATIERLDDENVKNFIGDTY